MGEAAAEAVQAVEGHGMLVEMVIKPTDLRPTSHPQTQIIIPNLPLPLDHLLPQQKRRQQPPLMIVLLGQRRRLEEHLALFLRSLLHRHLLLLKDLLLRHHPVHPIVGDDLNNMERAL